MEDSGTAPVERWTVTLRRVSPCEHGVSHSTLGVAIGITSFSCPECKDTKGNPRSHEVTQEKYPETYRRR